MKVGILIDRVREGAGGAEAYVFELATFLRERGDEAVLFCMDEKAPSFPGQVRRLPGLSLPRGFRELAFSQASASAVKTERCDLSLAIRHVASADIYQPHGGSLLSAWRARLSCKSGWKAAAARMALPLDGKFAVLRQLEKKLLRSAKKILPVSQFSAEEFRRDYPGSEQKLQVLSLGVDLARFSPQGEKLDWQALLGEKGNLKHLLFVAQDFDLKGLDSCLRALGELQRRQPDFSLLVVGKGKNLSRWQQRAEGYGVLRGLHFLGERKDLPSLYRSADLLWHPTFYDPCSRVVMEALASGLPAITTRQNGACEIESEKLFVLDSPRDVAGLVESTKKALARFSLDERVPGLSEKYSAKKHFESLHQIFREVASRRANSNPL